MAHQFTRTSSMSLTGTNPISGATPLTMACWTNLVSIGSPDQLVMGLFNNGVNNLNAQVIVYNNTGNTFDARTYDGSSNSSSNGAFAVQNVWVHVAAVFAAANSRTIYVNGSSGGANTTSRTPTGINSVAIGGAIDSTPDRYLGGKVMEAAIWDAALTAAEILELALAMAPPAVRPGNLVSYWPLHGNNSPEPDLVGGFNLTLNLSLIHI